MGTTVWIQFVDMTTRLFLKRRTKFEQIPRPAAKIATQSFLKAGIGRGSGTRGSQGRKHRDRNPGGSRLLLAVGTTGSDPARPQSDSSPEGASGIERLHSVMGKKSPSPSSSRSRHPRQKQAQRRVSGITRRQRVLPKSSVFVASADLAPNNSHPFSSLSPEQRSRLRIEAVARILARLTNEHLSKTNSTKRSGR
jgi:hypothetical protein